MYCEFYGLKEKPFSITPNPRYIFLSKNHQEAFAHLLYGIDNHAGFIELTGEVGTGKTTVLRALLNQFDDDRYRSAFIFNPRLSALELLRSINQEFGISYDGLSNAELLDALYRFLLDQNSAGRTVVLVIDEAQNLDPGVLEQVRLISNLETATDKLIQIVLAGQPELGQMLEKPELRQLSQRITVRYHLLPMDFEDTKAYIDHRLELAGGWRAATFDTAALKRIYSYSRGYPRLINIACDRALLIGFTEEDRNISGPMAATAIKEIRRSSRKSLGTFNPLKITGFCIAAGVLSIGIYLAPTQLKLHNKSVVTGPGNTIPSNNTNVVNGMKRTSPPTYTRMTSLRRQQQGISEMQSATAAFNILAKAWNVRPVKLYNKHKPVVGELEQMARKRGLQITPFQGKLEELLNFDTPVLLEFDIPGLPGKRYAALVNKSKGRIQVEPHLLGMETLSSEELNGFWSGKAYLLWKNHQNIPLSPKPDDISVGIIRLQILLSGAGFYRSEPNGIFDEATSTALKAYQSTRNIQIDGKPSGPTLLLLYRDSGKYATPRLTEQIKKQP